jgi:hypothetical protein
VSMVSAAGAVSLTLILLTVLLAVSLAAIVRSQAYAPAHAVTEAAADPIQPAPAAGPVQPLPRAETPTAPLPQRIPGESGRVAAATGELALVPEVLRHPRVSGRPPWDPAPEPPDMP